MEPRRQRAEAVEIGARLRRAREAKGLSKMALAAAVGVDRSLLTYLEDGRRAPSIFLAMALITKLEISPQFLLWGSLQGIDGELAAKLAPGNPLDTPLLSRRAASRAAQPYRERRRAS